MSVAQDYVEDQFEKYFDQPRYKSTKSPKKSKKVTRGPQANSRGPQPDKTDKLRSIVPLTRNQAHAFAGFQNGDNLILYGYAGTGKSFCGLFLGLQLMETDQSIKQVVIYRSAVPGREIGFLPGTDKEKLAVYETPYKNIVDKDLFARGGSYENLKRLNAIAFESTSFNRGITLDNCVVVVDEAQNMTYQELYTLITRLGSSARLILCGDVRQCDLVKKHDESGFGKILEIFKSIDNTTRVEFGIDDIVRGPLVKQFIIAATEYEST